MPNSFQSSCRACVVCVSRGCPLFFSFFLSKVLKYQWWFVLSLVHIGWKIDIHVTLAMMLFLKIISLVVSLNSPLSHQSVVEMSLNATYQLCPIVRTIKHHFFPFQLIRKHRFRSNPKLKLPHTKSVVVKSCGWKRTEHHVQLGVSSYLNEVLHALRKK